MTHPQSIALVGVSDDPTRVSGRALSFLKRYGYAGQIFPVNHRSATVQGMAAYRRIEDLPISPDLALISLSSSGVLEALRSCAAKGVTTAIVYASGFAEQDERGALLQAEVAEFVAGSGMRVLGPNCLGAVSPVAHLTATFATAFDAGELQPGGVALLTQSGAFASFVFGLARSAGVDFGFLATTGNEMDLTISELLQGVIELPYIDSVLLHVEGIRDLERFRQAAERARELDKPIAIVKVGTSEEGAAAALAHTNSDTGDDALYDRVFEEYGIHRVESMSDLAEAAQVFQSTVRPRGSRVTIVSVSGGTGVLMTDIAVAAGLTVPVLPDEVRRRLATAIPPFGSTRNPVDVTGGVFDDLPTFETVLRCCMDDDSTDMVLVAVGNAAATEVQLTEAIIAAASSRPKPLFVAWVGGGADATRRLNEAGVPTFSDPSRTVRAAALAARVPARSFTTQ